MDNVWVKLLVSGSDCASKGPAAGLQIDSQLVFTLFLTGASQQAAVKPFGLVLNSLMLPGFPFCPQTKRVHESFPSSLRGLLDQERWTCPGQSLAKQTV